MLSMIVRYGIVALAAAVAALSGSEARGGWWSHHCASCATGCARRACDHGLFHRLKHGQRDGCCADGSRLAAPLTTPPFRRRAVAVRLPVLPPPGTLGLTYHQLSRAIPEHEHPRTGMLEVCGVPAHLHVTVNGMEGYRGIDGVWYLKTVRPLIPCVPFIKSVRVHAPHVDPQRCPDIRVLRLIPGRVVSLSYRVAPRHGS